MSKMQRIVLVSELFYPEESATAHILTKIAGELASKFNLLVLTGPASYEGRDHLNAAILGIALGVTDKLVKQSKRLSIAY